MGFTFIMSTFIIGLLFAFIKSYQVKVWVILGAVALVIVYYTFISYAGQESIDSFFQTTLDFRR